MKGILIIIVGFVGMVFLIGNLDILETGMATANTSANISHYGGFQEITNSLVWLAIVGFIFMIGAAWWSVTHKG